MDLGLVLTPLVLISVVIYVAWPLLNEKKEFLPQEGTEREIAEEEKDNVISNLKDIEMDYRMGKLSDEDYETLRDDFKLRAMKAIKKVESLEKKKRHAQITKLSMGSPPEQTLLLASELTKRFGAVAAVRNVDFQVSEGDFVSIFGPNGAGKTTLLQLIAKISRPTQGVLEWFPDRPDQSECSIGFVSHQSLLYGELSGFENLLFFARLYRVPRPQERALELLDRMGLDRAGQRLTKHYSSGMKQRLTLARALIHDPEVLLLDEPYAGLDQHGSRLLTEVLAGLREGHRTVLLITHNLSEGVTLSNRVLIMNRGEIVYQAGGEEIESGNLEKLYFSIVEG